ncbi:MFS transporter [Paraburkholderia sp. EG286B]|uniref:MFS transporter n=1 Tax=Paraburkholderia sp. EG286B TaxID=3237011 RepID=UPI0034D2260E
MDVREAIRTQPMRRLQIIAVLICVAVCMMDGFEMLMVGFIAPHLAKAWSLSQIQVGYLLSASVFGTAIGAGVIGPLADRIGRRRHVIVCLLFIVVCMVLSALVTSIEAMIVLRAITGLFIGAIVVPLHVTVSEYSSDRWRGPVMGLYGLGLPFGASVGGAVSAALVGQYGWQAAFAFAAVLSGVVFILAYFLLPESIEFLLERRPVSALKQYNAIASKLGYPTVMTLPDPIAKKADRTTVTAIFGGIMGKRTILLWIANTLMACALYFANTWTAKLIADATGNLQLGVKAALLVPVGGMVGALAFAGLSTKMRPRLATVVIMIIGVVSYTLFSHSFGNISLAMALALLVGVAANGGAAAYLAISPSVYTADVRATGVGWMIGVARFISIGAPIGTGYLLTAGLKPADAFQFFAVVLAISAVACLLLDRTYRDERGESAAVRGVS